MSGRMPAAFCVYPTVHIKSERKCICLYTQNVLLAAVVKMCIPYHTHLFIKKVYTLLYIQNHSALPIFPLPAAMCTHMHMHFISKKCTPYHTYQFAGSSQEKKTKHSFAGQVKCCNHIAGCTLRDAGAAPLHCSYSSTTHTVHTICRPYTPLPRPGPACPATLTRCRAHKNKKRCKNTGNTRCIKKKNMKKEIKMNKYRKKNQKNKRK